ncbi:hypothetical protein HUK65_14210 [Rhodobacteraceae bacterium 2376]|uniref:Uncharacterized protein n=1 Tax=Rhabdonatronobacter sediminivivens TaxID=2743469 RepID=A0A7Z0I245_9RHOB|nr:hypothetical protein [Rhabdonatronobacter sediminivivens]NYS26144.1 hypothetical protein [Rhabdonatronobacter sediminivivens]
MTIQTRLRLTNVLGSLILVAPFAAGLGGFDPVMWIVFWAIFALWFLGVQAPLGEHPMPLAAALTAQGAVVALLMGLGHAAGLWADAVLPAWLLIGGAVGALLLGRWIRVPPEEIEALVRQAANAADAHDTQPEAAEAPEPVPEPDPEPEPEPDYDPDAAQDALAAMARALDALDPVAPDAGALAEALRPALTDAGPRAVAAALFERAAGDAPLRERRALVALMAEPQVVSFMTGEKLPARVFDAIAAEDCEIGLAGWAVEAGALLDQSPATVADFPTPARIDQVADRYAVEDTALCARLQAIATQLRESDGAAG